MPEDNFVEQIEQQQEHPEGVEQQTQEASQTPAAPDLTKALAELTETMRGTRNEPRQQQQERPPTQDEIDAYWAVYNPEKEDPQFFRKFFKLNPEATPEEAQAALAESKKMWGGMQTGLVRQAVIV